MLKAMIVGIKFNNDEKQNINLDFKLQKFDRKYKQMMITLYGRKEIGIRYL